MMAEAAVAASANHINCRSRELMWISMKLRRMTEGSNADRVTDPTRFMDRLPTCQLADSNVNSQHCHRLSTTEVEQQVGAFNSFQLVYY